MSTSCFGARDAQLRRGAHMVPRARGLPDRPRPLSRAPREGEGGARRTRDREPQRRLARRMAAITPSSARRRRGRARAQRLRGRGRTPRTSAAAVEERTAGLVREVRSAVSIPLAVKVGPFYSAFAHMAARLEEAGADGLVLFNASCSRTSTPGHARDLALARALHPVRAPSPRFAGSRSSTGVSTSASPGRAAVHDWQGALKLFLAGADVAMTASAALARGPHVVAEMIEGIRDWMIEREYTSIEQLKGSMSQTSCPDPPRSSAAATT